MLKFGNKISFESGEYIEKLKPSIYEISSDANGNPVLLVKPSFEDINLEGKSKGISDLVVNHYNNTTGNFGIMLNGISGMGKTRTLKHICNRLNLPVITVTANYKGSYIKEVLDNVNCDCVLVIDEFEKIYSKQEDSESLLSLFDGLDTKNRLFVIVSFNERRYISKYSFGRPGRFLFNFSFYELDQDSAFEFINSKIILSEPDRMKKYLSCISDVSYDICDKIVKLIKVHGEKTFIENSQYFNVIPQTLSLRVEFYINDKLQKIYTLPKQKEKDLYFDISGYSDRIDYVYLNYNASKIIEKMKIGDNVEFLNSFFKEENKIDNLRLLVKISCQRETPQESNLFSY